MKLVSNKLIEVKPLSKPSGILFYLDFQFSLSLKIRIGKSDFTEEEIIEIQESPELMGLYAKHIIKSDYISKPKRKKS